MIVLAKTKHSLCCPPWNRSENQKKTSGRCTPYVRVIGLIYSSAGLDTHNLTTPCHSRGFSESSMHHMIPDPCSLLRARGHAPCFTTSPSDFGALLPTQGPQRYRNQWVVPVSLRTSYNPPHLMRSEIRCCFPPTIVNILKQISGTP